MSGTEATPAVQQSHTLHVYVARGVIAIAWAAVFAAVSETLTTGVGVLLVLYPLIDAVASLIDAQRQRGSTRQLLLADAAVSAIAAIGLGIAATGSREDVFAVFGAWALISGLAQFVVALRRGPRFGKQWPMLFAGIGSILIGTVFIVAATRNNPPLEMLAIYAATGGADFLVEAWLLVRRRRRDGETLPAGLRST
jgi:uncharacterized membrane protein HdeD (DUF308 family)